MAKTKIEKKYKSVRPVDIFSSWKAVEFCCYDQLIKHLVGGLPEYVVVSKMLYKKRGGKRG